MNKLFLIWLCLLQCVASVTFAQPGFDKVYSFSPYPSFTVFSDIRMVLPDTQKIIMVGETISDTVGNANESILLGASDYTGNLIWKKNLSFSAPQYRRNAPGFLHSLIKAAPNLYVLGGNGYDCETLPECHPRPFIYIFNGNGDSLRFQAMPYQANQNVFFLNSLVLDRQKNIVSAGSFWNNTFGDTMAVWLSKFDSAGNFKWRKVIADTPSFRGSQCFRVLNANENNGYLLTGIAMHPDSTYKTSYCFWRTDTAGNVLWRRHLPKPPGWVSDDVYANEAGTDIIPANNGSGYYFMTTAPSRVQFPGEPPSYRVVYFCGNIDNEANVVWAKTYERDTLHMESSWGIAQKTNGDLVFMGNSSGIWSQEEQYGISLFSTDSMGNVKWMRQLRRYTCTFPIGQKMRSLKIAPNGALVMGGTIFQSSPSPGCYDTADAIGWLVLTDSLGRRNATDTATYPLYADSVIFPVDTTTSVRLLPGMQGAQLRLFPNPATDKTYLELVQFAGNTNDVQCSLYDQTGRLLQQRNMTNHKEALDLSGYSPGLYFIRLRYQQQEMGTVKVMKR